MTTPYSRAGLRPEVQALLDAMLAARPADRVIEANAMRAADPIIAAIWNIGAPAVARDEEIRIPTPAGELRALVVAPDTKSGRELPVLLHFHGGGFVIMTPECTAKLCKRLAVGTGAIVVSLDYRRAPEHPYPAPLDDCVAAYRWLRGHAAEIGGDPRRIALSGDSAGGNLAAATVLRAQAEGDAPPSAVLLACAWLDLAMQTRSFAAFGPDDVLIDDAAMTYWRSCYTPLPEQWADAFVSPLRGDLGAFPPSCIVIGGIDPLYDDGIRFAEALRNAGRTAELHEYAGMPHEFLQFPPLDTMTDAVERMAAFLIRAFQNEA